MGVLGENELVSQSIEFSVLIVEYYKWLVYKRKELVMSNQILKSGTSIGANIHEAQYGSSRADFINKMQIALKEASETTYWLIVLERTGYVSENYEVLRKYCDSLRRMLIATINTAKNTQSN